VGTEEASVQEEATVGVRRSFRNNMLLDLIILEFLHTPDSLQSRSRRPGSQGTGRKPRRREALRIAQYDIEKMNLINLHFIQLCLAAELDVIAVHEPWISLDEKCNYPRITTRQVVSDSILINYRIKIGKTGNLEAVKFLLGSGACGGTRQKAL
jgi:hypothetical protein